MFSKLKSFFLENHDTRQTIAKNTAWLFIGQTVSRVLRAGIVIYAARILSVGSWGAFSYALGIATFLTVFSDIGLNALITKTASRDPSLRTRYVATALGVKLALIIVLFIGTLIIFPRVARIEEATAIMPILLFLFAFDTIRDLGSAIARSMEKMQIEAGVHIWTNGAIAIFGFVALILHPSSEALALGYALGSGFGMCLLLYKFRDEFKDLINRFDRTLVRQILTKAWPFGLLGLMGVVMLNSDIIMIGSLRSAEEVGYYSAAQKIIQILYMLPTFLAVSAFPSLARTLKDDPETGKKIFSGAVRLAVIASIPIALIGIFFAKPIMLLLFGQAYLASVTAFQILISTVLIVFPSSIVGNAIFAYDAEKSFISLVAVAVLGNIFFNVLLIPRFGIEGSAFSTLITQILVNGLLWIKIKKLERSS